MALRVFYDYDRIIHHKSRRQSNSEERQGIDRKIEDLDESKSANERYRNGDRRNNRGTPVQQKQEDHNDDDEDRFFQRRYHFSHRVTDDGRRIEGDHVLNSWRKRLG